MSAPPDSITAPLIILRRQRPEDVESLFSICTHPEVAHFMDWPMPTEVESVRSHFERRSADWVAGLEHQWVIVERQTGAIAGSLSFRPHAHAVDFGYFLGRAFWGRGLAFDAATAVLHWLDTQSHVLRVWATVDAENLRSRRLLERLGLQLEGVMRSATFRPNIGGQPRDTALYARLRNSR
jgi:[ribosomal protein S5]-alanine N-acetyltransferase